ncbi:Nucleoporin Nup88 [Trinorchestia longiramus]|nr:Nucleoporin Nup88 [Trinorchestia longiramus]
MSVQNKFSNFPLCKKLSESAKENVCLGSNQSSLIAVVDDNLLIWSQEDCCFYAQHLQQHDSVVQTLSLTRPPLWSVQSISVNKQGTGVLLVGRRGVGVVDLPQRWGKHYTFDGGRENITCRTEYIAERFLVCHLRIAVVAAQWHPGSANGNHVVLLASDHYLRVYSLRSRDVPEQALAISVPRPDSVFSRHSSSSSSSTDATTAKFGSSVLGEEAVDFAIGAPVVTAGVQKKQDVGEVENSADAAGLFWPVFVLYANGDVYHTYLTLQHRCVPHVPHPAAQVCTTRTSPCSTGVYHTYLTLQHRIRSRTVLGPLVLLPPREDNYALEWCSVCCVGEGGVGSILVLATTGGRLFHCVVMPPSVTENSTSDEPGEDELKLTRSLSRLSVAAPLVSLYVYECVDLQLSLCPDQANSPWPFMLATHHSFTNRYLVLHSAGVHTVTVSLVDKLRNFTSTSNSAADGLNEDSECSVEHLVCTQALPSAAVVPVMGATVWCGGSVSSLVRSVGACELLVLLSSGTLLAVRMPSLLPRLPSPLAASDSSTKTVASPCEDMETIVHRLLQRNVSQPLLAGSSSLPPDPVEALDLTNRTLSTLRSQYFAPQLAAANLITHRVRVLQGQQRTLDVHIKELQQQQQQLMHNIASLQKQLQLAKEKQESIFQRLDQIYEASVRRLPGLSSGERWLQKELQSVQDQVPQLRDDLQHLHTKLQWHDTIAQMKSSNTSQDFDDVKLSQNQLHSLKETISLESDKIAKLVSRFKNMKKNLEV